MTKRTLARYPTIFGRLYGSPLLLLPEKAFQIDRVFQKHLERPISALFDDGPAQPADDDGDGDAPAVDSSGYTVTPGGVAIIDVMGTLVQRSSFMDAMSGIMSYCDIGYAFAQAEADPDVKGILLEIDSPGGEVNGCFDLVDEIAASTKPVWACANEAAYSAAYAIASAADKIVMPRTAGVGAIGVLMMHVDQSAKDAKSGYTFTPIYAGAKKTAGTPHEPLPDDVKADLQAHIDSIYQIFVSTVALNRGITAEAVRATEADFFTPDEAIALGLADQVGTMADCVAQFEALLAKQDDDPAPASAPAPGTTGMPPGYSTTAVSAATSKGIDMDPKDTAAQPANTITAAQAEEARVAALAEGTKTGAAAERVRVAAILNSDEAKGRGEMATHLAMETDMTSEAAIKLLAKAPKVDAKPADATRTPFDAAMDAAGNPKILPDDGDAKDGKSEAAAMDEAVQAIAKYARKPATASK